MHVRQHSASPRRAAGRHSLLAAVLLTVGSSLLAAAPVHITTPADGATLVAGELVEVRWQGLPVDVDEMELLLEVDRSAQVRVRLTPQLAAASRGYTWRVPNLPGRNACLRLRWGRAGVETEGAPSGVFTILADPAAPLDGTRYRRGEWWLAAGQPSSLDMPCNGFGRTFELPERHSQPATTSVVEEIDSGQVVARHSAMTAAGAQRAPASTIRAEVSACRPLTFPLRP